MSTFTTGRLKELVAYAVKGAGFSKSLELANYMGIQVADGLLHLNTTDGENYLRVSDACLADPMDIVVNADLFSKLISKITSDTVDMSVEDNSLVVKGNGTYKLELVPDETGNILAFPNKFPDEVKEIGKISASDLVVVANALSASLSSVVGSVYSNYYFGDVVASTDKTMMCIFNKKLFKSAYLFNSNFVDLMCMGGTDVTVSKSDDMILAEANLSEKCTISVCTKIPSNASEFSIANVNKFAALEVPSFCRVSKAELLNLLDRLSLFVSKFDDGAIQLNFTKDALEVSSIASSGVERIEYAECKDVEPITIKINIERLRSQLKVYLADMVDLYFGSEICIKLVDGEVSQIIALIK